MKHLLVALALFVAAPWSAAAQTCWISEYIGIQEDANQRDVPVAHEPAIATQTISLSGPSPSAPFNASTRFIRLVCDVPVHFVFVTAATDATSSHPLLPGNSQEYFGVARGQGVFVELLDAT